MYTKKFIEMFQLIFYLKFFNMHLYWHIKFISIWTWSLFYSRFHNFSQQAQEFCFLSLSSNSFNHIVEASVTYLKKLNPLVREKSLNFVAAYGMKQHFKNFEIFSKFFNQRNALSYTIFSPVDFGTVSVIQ